MRRLLFGLAPDEASFARRGFRGAGEPAQARLERIGSTFITGYMAALDDTEPGALVPVLEAVDAEVRGFAYEGAAMALALLDMLAPWDCSRVQRFLEGSGYHHVYMTYVGMGWAWARLRRGVARRLAQVDPLLGWLAVDGYGFHEGFFHGARYVEQRQPAPLAGYAARAFDQGLGRSLWFVEGAGVGRIIHRVRSFPEARQPDLWSGVGLACAYAGGVDRADLEELARASGPHLPQLRQGSVFATRARERAGNVVPHVELACDVLFGQPASVVAPLADQAEQAVAGARGDIDTPRFELWRQHIQQLTSSVSGAA